MWARAIIFGIELVGFIIFSVFATIKFYKRHCIEKDRNYTIKNLKFNLIYSSINFAIILALFFFTYPSLVFLSYNKLLLISLVELLSILIILLSYLRVNKVRDYIMITMASISFVIILIISIDGIIGSNSGIIENKLVISEQTETQTITSPTMFTENQVGFVTDNEGNTKTYVFYYKDNDIWNYKELKVSETKIIRIQDKDTYIEETVTKTEYCKKEKKPSAKDYNYVEEKVKHTLYLNLRQRVEIKKTD